MTTESGVVGGVDVLAMSLLVFLAGTLLVAAAWGAVDARGATSAATREAVRSFAESGGAPHDAAAARSVADEVLTGHGRDPDRLRLDLATAGTFGRCLRVRATGRYSTTPVALPFGLRVGAIEVRVTHTEIVDPLRGGLGGAADCVA